MKFSKIEARDLAKAWIVISIAFGILITKNYFSYEFLSNFVISLFTVGVGFLLHELAHKFVAQRYHYYAEFRSDDKMLVISIISAFFGFLFAAPGGVLLGGGNDSKKFSLIAAAGPATNILLALVFLIFFNFDSLSKVGNLGFMINSWLALFNLIPIFPFDGKKIFDGNKKVYFTLLIISILLMIIQFFPAR